MTLEPDPDGQMSCPECSALNIADAKFCADCGCVLVAKTQRKVGKVAGRRRGARADAVEKSRARQEFARIKNIVLTVRFVYWSSAVLAAVFIGMWHTVLALFLEYAYGDWHLAMTILVYSQFALVVAGAVFVMRGPLLWTIVGACNWTLNTAHLWWLVKLFVDINALIEQNRLPLEQIQIGMLTVFVGFWTLMLVAFWFAVAQAARVQRLMAENPELSIVRQRFDPSRRVEGGVAEQVRARRREEGREAWRGRLKLAGMIAGGLAIVIAAIWFATRPPTVDATLEKFASRWGRGDVEGVADLFEGGTAGSTARAMQERLERLGWLDALPALGKPEIADRGTSVRVGFDTRSGAVEATFHFNDKEWQLAGVSLPPLQPSDPQEAFDAFRKAWNAAGPDALLALFRPAMRERQGRMLRSILEKRNWTALRPRLGPVDAGRDSGGSVRALFGLGFDDLSVRFEYWHPNWYVVGFVPPRG